MISYGNVSESNIKLINNHLKKELLYDTSKKIIMENGGRFLHKVDDIKKNIHSNNLEKIKEMEKYYDTNMNFKELWKIYKNQ